jgi:gluconolactonase
MQRRCFLQATAALSLAAFSSTVDRARAADRFDEPADRYAGLKPGKYLGAVKSLVSVAGPKVFTEGPCCDRAGNVYFTNAGPSQILKRDGSKLSVFREPADGANGLLFDRQGRLVACEGTAGRVTRTDMATGKIEVLADKYNGHGLGMPNDLTFDAAGRIYFTSRLPNAELAAGNVNSVYRIDIDGSLHVVLQLPAIHMPNGIVLSPDDKTLYLVESHAEADKNRCILAFDLSAEGVASKPRRLIEFYPGRSGDGMAIDREGNLYIAAGLHKTRKTSETLATRPGIHVFTPKGELVDFVETPEDTLTNCRFGGEDLKTLYITCGRQLLSVPTVIAGKSMYRPEK